MVEILAMQDAYMDVGGRQCLERIVEQLQMYFSPFTYWPFTLSYPISLPSPVPTLRQSLQQARYFA